MNRIILLLPLISMLTMCGTTAQPEETTERATQEQKTIATKSAEELAPFSKAYFAAGCFWCVEAVFESVEGVQEAISGYSGGTETDPTYEQVGRGATSHAEAVEVYYDAKVIDYRTLVAVYYGSHDPTTVDGQAPDFGRQYRSMILFSSAEEEAIAKAYKTELEASGKYSEPIATEIVPFEKFWRAEEYHQNYEKLHPNESYVRSVSIPRLKAFQKKFPELLKRAE